jgi:hypothetical protein
VLKNIFVVKSILCKALIIKGYFSTIFEKHGYFNTVLGNEVGFRGQAGRLGPFSVWPDGWHAAKIVRLVVAPSPRDGVNDRLPRVSELGDTREKSCRTGAIQSIDFPLKRHEVSYRGARPRAVRSRFQKWL